MQNEDQQEEERKYFQNLFFNSMHFGIPALIVETYDDNPFLIKTVQPFRSDSFIDPDDDEIFKVPLPTISNVPFTGHMMFGNFLISLPLKKGDKVWLTGCDISLDDLLELKLENISDIDIRETRRLDLSDMVAVGSFATKKDTISDYDKDNLVLRTLDNSVYLKIKSDGEIIMKGSKLFIGSDTANKALAIAQKVMDNFNKLIPIATAWNTILVPLFGLPTFPTTFDSMDSQKVVTND